MAGFAVEYRVAARLLPSSWSLGGGERRVSGGGDSALFGSFKPEPPACADLFSSTRLPAYDWVTLHPHVNVPHHAGDSSCGKPRGKTYQTLHISGTWRARLPYSTHLVYYHDSQLRARTN
jgi:hypothetical protein